MKHLITERELCGRLSCCRRTLAKFRSLRLIPYVRIGKMVRYDSEAVNAALEKLTVKEVG